MFDCHDPKSDGYDYHTLVGIGVNIFNVDLTKHDTAFLNNVKQSLKVCQDITEMYPSDYYVPVGLSVMVSVKQPFEIDDRVDIIILKDITKEEELLEFRKQNKKYSSIPILLWASDLTIDVITDLMKKSSGVIFGGSFSDGACDIVHALKAGRDLYKPVFHFEPDLLQDFAGRTPFSEFRRNLIYMHNVVKYGFDGVIVVECAGKSPAAVIQTLIKATKIAQRDIRPIKEHFKRSIEPKIPILPPMCTAFGASLAALKSGAVAILVLTMSGTSARILSHTSPSCYIIAVTAHEHTARYMHLYKNVTPVYYRKKRALLWQDERWARITFGTQFGVEIGLFDFTAKLVVLTPSEESTGYCDCFQILKVSDIVKRGYRVK